jgi:hypothetical protein
MGQRSSISTGVLLHPFPVAGIFDLVAAKNATMSPLFFFQFIQSADYTRLAFIAIVVLQ